MDAANYFHGSPSMAAQGVDQQNGTGHEYQVHQRNYAGFLTILRRSAIAVAIVTAIVIYIIAN